MKKLTILSIFFVAVSVIAGCDGVRRDPGKVYMPDMAYSRAYETYSVTDSMREDLAKKGIHFSNIPVPGTIKRGEIFPFLIEKDKEGDTTNYYASRAVKNPLTAFDTVEATRLYLVNCAICHGQKMDGNGPLYKDGNGPFAAKPATLVGDARYESMPEGQMYYSVTYGKNKMGSYASQLNTHQRWMVIGYIKSKQGAGKVAPETTTAPKPVKTAGAGSDTAAKK
ncbi:MAG TPA: cytochrome c [Puia sp.]|nr:cytochrome c [Puia sp.]